MPDDWAARFAAEAMAKANVPGGWKSACDISGTRHGEGRVAGPVAGAGRGRISTTTRKP